jgi:hypothetical protein
MYLVSSNYLPTAQMPMGRGIKEFGSDGIEAVKAELKQLQPLHDRVVMKPKSPKEQTRTSCF